MFLANRRVYLRILTFSIITICFGVFILLGGLAYGQDIIPPPGLSGAHKVLDCGMCHAEGVWHEASKDSTVCQNCHPEQWDTLGMNSLHVVLMTEGSINRGGEEFEVKYCSTCHSPHNNDYLRISRIDQDPKYYTFDDFTSLCVNCHFFGGEGGQSPMNGGVNTTTTRTTTRTTTTTTTTTTQTTTTTTTTQTTTISMTPAALTIPLSSSLTIEGKISPAIANADVTIEGRPADSEEWDTLGTVQTTSGGEYEFIWTPTSAGNFVFLATYGDYDSGVYTVIVSDEDGEGDGGLMDMIMDLFSNTIILVAVIVVVIIIIVAIGVVFRGRGKK